MFNYSVKYPKGTKVVITEGFHKGRRGKVVGFYNYINNGMAQAAMRHLFPKNEMYEISFGLFSSNIFVIEPQISSVEEK